MRGGQTLAASGRRLRSIFVTTFAPMLLQPCKELPSGERWRFEVKWDGFRSLCRASDGAVSLTSRNGKQLSKRFPLLASELARCFAGRDVLVDGEICALDADGRPSFTLLQQGGGQLVYVAFDLIEQDGEMLIRLPLGERRARLEELLRSCESQALLHSRCFEDGDAVLAFARERGLEGVVAKDVMSVYKPGVRVSTWRKLKLLRQGQFLVAGVAAGALDARFGALVLAEPSAEGFRWVGNVGSGFSSREIASLAARVVPLARATCPFGRKPRSTRLAGEVIWLEPQLLCEIEFLERTAGGQLRQPTFKGLIG
jgi:bifunctional non-homologous end joining protein LigD